MSTTNDTKATAAAGTALSEGLGRLVERLLAYSDIRRNDPRESREALRDLIVGELADELRAARAAERERCAQVCEAAPIIGRSDQEAFGFSNALETCAAAIRRA